MPDRALRTHVRRDAVAVSGPDAVTYLQGQVSQDVAALAVGASAWSWLLQPAGKVDALVRVTRTGPDGLLVDVDEGYGEAVLQRLQRFKLRTRAELAATPPLTVWVVRGRGAVEEAGGVAATAQWHSDPPPVPLFEPPALVVTALWGAGEAADILTQPGAALTWPPDVAADLSGAGWEAERIAAGVPAMGAELTDRTIPAETGLVAITASFTKGCYTGQELVARIDSRGGNVPRHLRALRAASPLTTGEELTNEVGKVVGTVTSAAVHPDLGPVGLGYVARSVTAGSAVDGPAGPVTVLGAGADAGAGDA